MLLHRLSPICVSRSNSLIFNFANKNEYDKKYIQSAVLRERQQGERRYCPHHGTSDNQRYCGAVQLQADHPKTLWDAKGNRAKGKSAEARNINLALDNIKAQIIKHYQRISDREAYVTAEMVRNAYQGVGSEYETLIKAFDKDCANFLKRVGKDRSIGTYKVMVRARNYVAAFIKSFYKRTDMSMLELTPDFIKEFAAYLTAERGLKNATIWLNCMWLKGVVMRAHYNGLIPRNPFAQFHISPNVKEREYLTEDEIKRIMAHEFDNPTLALVRDLFIFACFTALSFVDMERTHNG